MAGLSAERRKSRKGGDDMLFSRRKAPFETTSAAEQAGGEMQRERQVTKKHGFGGRRAK